MNHSVLVTLEEHFKNMNDKLLLARYEDKETSGVDRHLLVTEIKRRGLRKPEKMLIEKRIE